jgi:glucose dehydrogenase
MPLVRIAAVGVALFSFFGISLAGAGNSFVSHVPGLALIVLAVVPIAFARKSLFVYVATVVVALIGAAVAIDFAVRYSESSWLLDVLLFALFALGFALARRRTEDVPSKWGPIKSASSYLWVDTAATSSDRAIPPETSTAAARGCSGKRQAGARPLESASET